MVLRGENMIITNSIAKKNIANYSNKNNKLSRDIKDGKLFKIIKGLYETDPNTYWQEVYMVHHIFLLNMLYHFMN